MDQRLKELFLQTISPNDEARNSAETQLKHLEKNTEFLNYVKNVLMSDANKSVQQTSSIYFMNTIERHWKAPELRGVITDIENSILDLLLIEEKYPKLAVQKMLQCIFEHSQQERILKIFRDSRRYLAASDIEKSRAALILFEEVFRSESLRFNLEEIFEVMFNELGQIFTGRFTEYISTGRYSYAGMCMKIIGKAYACYTLPTFLDNICVFTGYVQAAAQILNMPGMDSGSFSKVNDKDGLLKMQKWAAFFLYKATSKGVKKYFRNSYFVSFIRSESTLKLLETTFMKVLNDFVTGKVVQDRVPVICADFFGVMTSNKHTRPFIADSCMFLLNSFILPVQSYVGDIKDDFEDDPDAYLRKRHSYFDSDLRTSTCDLFVEILHCAKDVEMGIVESLVNFLSTGATDSVAPTRYGIIGLLANAQKQLIKNLGEEDFYIFLNRHVFADLSAHQPFLISQALYFLSLTEGISVVDENLYAALNRIFLLVNGENEILSVEACLALNAFFYTKQLTGIFEPLIPSLFEKVLYYSRKYFLESLSTLSDSIIDCFTPQIMGYAPTFVQSLCSSFMDHIEADRNEQLSAVSGCLNTIEKLILAADDKPEIVQEIYKHASSVIFYTFQHQKGEFYQECFDLMNSFMFVLRTIQESMFDVFILALSADKDDLALFPLEVCDYIDNFLTYGGERVITQRTLELIYTCIDTFMPLNGVDSEMYDEDFEAACKIIDSLLLNCGRVVHQMNQNLIPAIVQKLVANHPFAEEHYNLLVYEFDSIINCFIVAPLPTLAVLDSFKDTFFSLLCANKMKFIRVYDKKLFVLFVRALFEISPALPMDYSAFCDVLEHMVTSLPAAIKKRNKLKEKEEREDDDGEEEEEEDSDASLELIYEDIYFETILDKLDPYEFIRGVLSSVTPGSTGEKIVGAMTPKQVAHMREVLGTAQEVQK